MARLSTDGTGAFPKGSDRGRGCYSQGGVDFCRKGQEESRARPEGGKETVRCAVGSLGQSAGAALPQTPDQRPGGGNRGRLFLTVWRPGGHHQGAAEPAPLPEAVFLLTRGHSELSRATLILLGPGATP